MAQETVSDRHAFQSEPSFFTNLSNQLPVWERIAPPLRGTRKSTNVSNELAALT